MFEAVKKELAEHTPDTFIGVAAVGDWRPVEYSESKLKKEKGQDTLTIKLIKNPDILSYVGHSGLCSAVIGFAAETDNLAENARKKLDSKAADMIVVNPRLRSEVPKIRLLCHQKRNRGQRAQF